MAEAQLIGSSAPAFPPHWQRYRDGYAVLQYLYAMADASERVPVTWPRVLNDLGLEEVEGTGLLDYLLCLRYLRYLAGERRVALTPEGIQYLRAGHGRRRSVRPPHPA